MSSSGNESLPQACRPAVTSCCPVDSTCGHRPCLHQGCEATKRGNFHRLSFPIPPQRKNGGISTPDGNATQTIGRSRRGHCKELRWSARRTTASPSSMVPTGLPPSSTTNGGSHWSVTGFPSAPPFCKPSGRDACPAPANKHEDAALEPAGSNRVSQGFSPCLGGWQRPTRCRTTGRLPDLPRCCLELKLQTETI